jgi:glycosyltransferase involved in cell wall biosynthesis
MNDRQPRVSIGLPVYNGEKFICETIDSILGQTFKDFELIICDNASTDRTEEICQAYVSQDRRIRYYRNQENLGAARNYNIVFELSAGEYFKWAAHDDLCSPTFLEKCVEVLDRIPTAVLSYPRLTYIDDLGKPIRSCSNLLELYAPKSHERFAFLQESFCNGPKRYDCWTTIFGLIRAKALRTTPLIGNYISSDIPLLARLAILGEFHEVPEYLFFVREHQDRSTSGNYQDIAAWFDPNNKGKIVFPLWREFFEHIIAINDCQLNFAEKISCYSHMSKWGPKRGRKLVKEVLMVMLQILDRASLWKFQEKMPKW